MRQSKAKVKPVGASFNADEISFLKGNLFDSCKIRKTRRAEASKTFDAILAKSKNFTEASNEFRKLAKDIY